MLGAIFATVHTPRQRFPPPLPSSLPQPISSKSLSSASRISHFSPLPLPRLPSPPPPPTSCVNTHSQGETKRRSRFYTRPSASSARIGASRHGRRALTRRTSAITSYALGHALHRDCVGRGTRLEAQGHSSAPPSPIMHFSLGNVNHSPIIAVQNKAFIFINTLSVCYIFNVFNRRHEKSF